MNDLARTSDAAAAARSDRLLPVPDRRAWVVLAMLWFVYVLNFLDRQLMSILAKPIQDTLNVTDGQLGLFGGLYFAMFYCFIAIPVGWLADRTNRVAVLSLACGIWSAATVACGLSRSYGEFAFARMTVGFGEAGGVPPSYAIITDYFPPGRRGTALGIYNLGPPVGAALGIAFGGAIAAAFNWRYAFIVLGLVGLIAAAVLPLLVKEPRRGALDRVGAKPALVGCAVQFAHHRVDGALFGRILADQVLGQLAIDGGHGLQHALAHVTGLVAVAFLDRFMGAGRSTRRHRRTTHRAVFQRDVDLDGRIAAAVQDLACENIDDGGHGVPFERSAHANVATRILLVLPD